jgi:hypothetical protein
MSINRFCPKIWIIIGFQGNIQRPHKIAVYIKANIRKPHRLLITYDCPGNSLMRFIAGPGAAIQGILQITVCGRPLPVPIKKAPGK